MINQAELNLHNGDIITEHLNDAQQKFMLAKQKFAELDLTNLLLEEIQEVRVLMVDVMSDLNLVDVLPEEFVQLKAEAEDFVLRISNLKNN